MKNKVISNAFSVPKSEIEKLRSLHRIFDEACEDFEELSALKASAERDGDTWTSEQAGASLEEVRIEIERKLHDLNTH